MLPPLEAKKETHKTSTTVNPLWPIPNAPETHNHTIWDPPKTHSHTICNPRNLTWDPRPHHRAWPNAPLYPWTHNTNLECQCCTHPPIRPPQSSNPYHNQQNPPTMPKPSNHKSQNHESNLTSPNQTHKSDLTKSDPRIRITKQNKGTGARLSKSRSYVGSLKVGEIVNCRIRSWIIRSYIFLDLKQKTHR